MNFIILVVGMLAVLALIPLFIMLIIIGWGLLFTLIENSLNDYRKSKRKEV